MKLCASGDVEQHKDNTSLKKMKQCISLATLTQYKDLSRETVH